jgi:hypothetical protein
VPGKLRLPYDLDGIRWYIVASGSPGRPYLCVPMPVMSTALPTELCSSILCSSAWVVRCVSASGMLSFEAVEWATETGS